MSDRDQSQQRRRFLKHAAMAVVVLPLAGRLAPARASDLPHLDTADPTAAALGYVEDATTVDAAKHANYKAGQTCANCNLIQAESGDWRPCALFPGKAVAAEGWCTAWVVKP
ncbi:MAG TPA: high-potential iron-sulfur protein [Xanthomonadaceae bacterium]|nr:high-potential iron-sulfur protein [Xanthomonadaceae bacterium]